jgi:hypothetical protein
VDANEEEGKEEQVKHEEDQVEHLDQIEHIEPVEPPAYTSFSNDKEVSTEALFFIIVPLETHMNPKLQFFNVSKSHLMPQFSRIYACKRAQLGIGVLRKSFEASKLAT